MDEPKVVHEWRGWSVSLVNMNDNSVVISSPTGDSLCVPITLLVDSLSVLRRTAREAGESGDALFWNLIQTSASLPDADWEIGESKEH